MKVTAAVPPVSFPLTETVRSAIIRALGEWRSLVARLLWEQEVTGSSPVSPTREAY